MSVANIELTKFRASIEVWNLSDFKPEDAWESVCVAFLKSRFKHHGHLESYLAEMDSYEYSLYKSLEDLRADFGVWCRTIDENGE